MRLRNPIRKADEREGWLATVIEEQTSKLPSDTFLWTALGCVAGAVVLHAVNRKAEANLVALCAPTLLIMGVYNKLVKQLGHD